ncbi:MAG: SDR family NAD(P)-dependent oxidoreductase, partial [Alphaproteobacteria bacterium]|nr:SDR family NAD(P)-dependent oxidoreductase [Alphaproteobacteria bacterium]
MNWQNETVLVTGAAGFIGSHLTEALVAHGAKTRALVRYTSSGHRGWLENSPLKNEIAFFQGDLRDRDSLRKAMAGVDTVFHLGALIAIPYSYEAPQSYLETNITGTLHVLEAGRDLGIRRIVHTSTSEVYGTARYVPIDEAHPLQGQSPYSATKIAADKLAESYFLSFGTPVVTVRPFNTYGPRQSTRAVIPTIITQALTIGEVKLGSLTPTRDLNFVADTVEGFMAAAAADQAIGQTVNLAQGKEISVGNLARLICEIIGHDARLVSDSERLRPAGSEVERLC